MNEWINLLTDKYFSNILYHEDNIIVILTVITVIIASCLCIYKRLSFLRVPTNKSHPLVDSLVAFELDMMMCSYFICRICMWCLFWVTVLVQFLCENQNNWSYSAATHKKSSQIRLIIIILVETPSATAIQKKHVHVAHENFVVGISSGLRWSTIE